MLILSYRPIESGKWNLRSDLPNKRILIENIRVPKPIDQLLPFGGISPSKHVIDRTVLVESSKPRPKVEKCIIDTKHVSLVCYLYFVLIKRSKLLN